MPEPTALLVSRDPFQTQSLRDLSESITSFRLETCPGAEQARARLRKSDPALLLVHLAHGNDGDTVVDLLQTVTRERRRCPTVVLSDDHDPDRTAGFIRAGVVDCLSLPNDFRRLSHLLEVLTLRVRLEPRPAPPASPGPAHDPFFDALPPEFGELAEQVRRVAPQETTLLLTGETGTGKTRLARLVHQLSGREHEPFLVVDCCALSANLIESELFGHVKGAFTGADRDRAGKLATVGRGTLLLDEVNSLPLELQGKLLRALDERVFEPVGSERSQPLRARLVAASNAPLEKEVAAGRFRSDLYYRLNVVGFHLPALRDRASAIRPLAEGFLSEFAGRGRADVVGFSAEALTALEGYHWPGNIRELRNVVERVVALCPGPQVQLRDLPETVRDGGASMPLAMAPMGRLMPEPLLSQGTLSQTKEEAEVRRITEALQKHNNNRLRAAAELGISRMGLYKKLHKYGLIDISV